MNAVTNFVTKNAGPIKWFAAGAASLFAGQKLVKFASDKGVFTITKKTPDNNAAPAQTNQSNTSGSAAN